MREDVDSAAATVTKPRLVRDAYFPLVEGRSGRFACSKPRRCSCILGAMWRSRNRASAMLLAAVVLASGCGPAVRVGRGPGESDLYSIRGKATLGDVAVHLGLGYVEVVAANPDVDPWLPGAGTKVVVPSVHLPPSAAHDGVVVNLADMRLYLYDAGKLLRSYPIGIGRDGLATPTGHTTIVRKQIDPSWRPTARMRSENPELPEVVPPGPDNPMGTRALYLAWSPYAIHGTNKPPAVGRRVSSGCLRLYPDDIVDLYDRVQVGTPVTLVDEPVKLAWIADELYMEAHPTQRQSSDLQGGKPITATLTPAIRSQVKTAAKRAASRLDWDTIAVVARERRGVPIRITR